MSRPTVTVTLKKPFESAKGTVREIILREPTGKEFFALGAPQTWVRSAGGMALVDNDEAIASYAERCIVEPDPVLAMSQMSVLDAVAVKDVICGFFIDTSTDAAATAP